MTYTLPQRRLLVHKAIDPDKVAKRAAFPLIEEAPGVPDQDFYLYQQKYDGCHCIIIIKGGDVSFFSRDGKDVKSLGHTEKDLQALGASLSDSAIFAEAWRPAAEFRTISGEFRRHAEQPQLKLVLFDAVPLEDFEAGECSLGYEFRMNAITKAYQRRGPGTLCLPLTYQKKIDVPATVAQLVAAESAFDGLIAKRMGGTWVAGAGTGGESLKVKNIVDLDLEVIGTEEGQGKHAGRLGAVVCRFKDGKELRVGTGFSDLERRAWHMEPSDIIGRTVRVVGLGDSGKGSIREPRYKGVRHDTDPDY